jgi:RNA methyltransferase, TrmH family
LRRGLVFDVFVTEAARERFAGLLAQASYHVVTDKAAKALSDTVTPVGLVAVCSIPEVALADVLAASPKLLLVAVGTSEPGNAGTLIRIADAMGADAVILAGDSVDPFNGKCLRASAGSIFGVPVLSVPDVAALLNDLADAGVATLATALDGELALPDADLTGPTAWLLGSEAHGLPAEVVARADARVLIPMAGSAESLNVAAAAAICLYQSAAAQRDS